MDFKILHAGYYSYYNVILQKIFKKKIVFQMTEIGAKYFTDSFTIIFLNLSAWKLDTDVHKQCLSSYYFFKGKNTYLSYQYQIQLCNIT